MTTGRFAVGITVCSLVVSLGLGIGAVTFPASATDATPSDSASPSPTPTPTPTPTATPSPTAGPSSSASPTGSPSASASASGSSSTVGTLADPPAPGMARYLVGVTSGRDQLVANAVDDLGGSIVAHYDKLANSLAVDMTSDNAQRLALANGVRYVEPDRTVSINTSNAIINDSGCTANSLTRGDDLGTPSVALKKSGNTAFSVNWFGTSYSGLYINNNGGVSFDDGYGPFTDYQFNLTTTTRPVILPLGTDVDTRDGSTSAVTYGPLTGTVGTNNYSGFCVNWKNVGLYGLSGPLVSAQLLILDRGSGNVDLIFNYDTISDTVTTKPFEIGYADPRNRSNSLRISGSSTTPTPFRDSGSASRSANSTVISGSPYTSVAGQHEYRITNGASPTATPTASATPTPSSSSSCPDSVPAGTQGCATWGLDRIDQRALPLDTHFTPAGTGSGVTAYIVDTGMLMTHTEFTGRVRAGYDEVDNDSDPTDCNGHGTHVAGTVGGTTYGVAKSVSLVPIRVLDCSGSGSTAGVIAGINWAITDHVSGPAVLSMSLGGGSSKSMDDAVAAAVADGITVVVAAGNSNTDACTSSPAEEPTAITVAASDSSDARASFSNYGSCVDIFAPGVSITSSWYSSTTATAVLSGTSMATPHVSGAAAVYLALHPTATPAQVVAALQAASTTGVVTDALSTNSGLLYARSFEAYTGGGGSGGGAGGGGSGGGGSSGGGSSGGGSSGGGGGSSGGGGGSSGGGGGGGSLHEITEVRPAFGPISGGNTIYVIGYGFSGASQVLIGGKNASYKVINDATVEVVVPAGDTLGSADVSVVLSATIGRAFAPGGYVYQSSSASNVNPAAPVGPTTPGVIGILNATFASLPSMITTTSAPTVTRSTSGVVSLRMGVSAAAAGTTATLYRGTKKVATAKVAADGSISFASKGIISGIYRVRLASSTKAVNTNAFKVTVPRR